MLIEDRKKIEELIEAACPFTSGDIVDETSETIILIDKLKCAIQSVEKILKGK